MEEDFFESADEQELLERFDKMLQQGDSYFFDSEEFEIIIDCYFESANMERALAAIKMARKQYPQSSCFKLKSARYLFFTGKIDQALKIIDQIRQLESENPELYMLCGQIFSYRNKSREAIEQFSKAMKHEDYEESAALSIAMEYECMGDYPKAVEWMKRALEANPENDRLLSDISFCYEILQKHDEAVSFFQNYLDEHPFCEIGWLNLGVAYFNLQQYELAVDAYDYAIAVEADFSSAYFNRGNALIALERYDEAIESYKEMLNLEKNDALTYFYIGECYERKEEYLSALHYYQRSIELDGQNPDAYAGAALCFAELERNAEALKCIEEALSFNNKNSEYLSMQAEILLKLGRFERACEVYKKITINDRDNFDVWLDYSHAWIEYGDIENGLDILRSGVVQHPESAELKYRMAALLAKAGKLKEATLFFEKALRLDPEGYTEAFDYYPAMKDIPTFLDMI